MSNDTKKKQPITEVEALAKISKILNQLDENARKKVLAFLSE